MKVASLFLALPLACFAFASAAAAQQAPPVKKPIEATGTVVMDAKGALRPPWTIKRLCSGPTGQCADAVFNTETKEIARFGDRWSTQFQATGNGGEVRRLAKRSLLPEPDTSKGERPMREL